MVGQLLPNTNEMLQCTTVPNNEFDTAKFSQLNTANIYYNEKFFNKTTTQKYEWSRYGLGGE
jgi:hypothetical protein